MIDILMATYNGGQYIEAQILSVIAQDYREWRLLVHDDGSTDDTVAVVRRISALDERIVLIDDGVNGLGAGANFLHLLQYSKAPLLMFCDQDDIWFSNKISLMLAHANHLQVDKPAVLYSNAYVWNPTAGIKGLATLTFPESLQSFLFLNSGVQGCVALFNSSLKNRLLEWKDDCAMHDHLLQLYALSFGSTAYLHVPLMLYRNHANNVTGKTQTRLLSIDRFLEHRRIPIVHSKHYVTVEAFSDMYHHELSPNIRSVIINYLSMKNKGFIGRLINVFRYQFKLYESTWLLVAKLFTRPYSL